MSVKQEYLRYNGFYYYRFRFIVIIQIKNSRTDLQISLNGILLRFITWCNFQNIF